MAYQDGGEMSGTATAADIELAADGFAPLRVKQVIRETADAVSLVFDVPGAHQQRFGYQSGQFLTVLVEVAGQEHRRCYSMSSSPLPGEDLRITVKRDRNGVVSNWLNDHAVAGSAIHAAPPAGRFVLRDSDRDVVAFAGGSGVTPVFSLIRSALAGTPRKIRLFYANRVRDSVIFDAALAQLTRRHPERLTVEHHLDEDSGVVGPTDIESFLTAGAAGLLHDADYYICGPTPFMATVEATLTATGVPGERVHLERFSVAEIAAPPTDTAAVTTEVTINLDRKVATVPYKAGHTVLQMARLAGLKAPSSCETGSCGTCMAQVVEGSARMLNNDALDDDEVQDGLILTCQAMPTSSTISVVYD